MIQVDTEINILKKVIVHSPDMGIERITPKKAEELLFDDIVYLPKMQEEHAEFKAVLEAFVGQENVLEINDLLVEALANDPVLKKEVLEMIIDDAELPKSTFHILYDMDHQQLAEVLISGYYNKEDHFLFDPIPNFIFTRDIAVVVKDHIIITKASKEARQRENFITRFILAAHPYFKQTKDKIINLNNVDTFPPSKKGERVSMEGGDMMMIEKEYLLIGCSERTTAHAFDSIKSYLFSKGVIDNVVKVNIPSDRSCMHIDTLFTRVSSEDLVCYKPIVYDGLGSNVIVYRSNGEEKSYASVKDFFLKEINPETQFIFSGMGETPFQEREQWTDGCNLVCVKPGVALTYDRNIMTAKGFEKAGYQIMPSKDFLESYKKDPSIVNSIEKTIITLVSGELSRARGGSHCMTCPLERETL